MIILLNFFFISINNYAKIVVIVNKSNKIKVLSKSMLKKIFLGKKTRWNDGRKIKAINLHPSLIVRKNFEKEFLKMSPRKVQKYWIRQAIRGNIYPPVTLSYQSIVLRNVVQDKGAIGYVEKKFLKVKLLKWIKIIRIKK